MKILSGTSNLKLSKNIAKNLKLNSGDIKGYYLKANFVNNSREAAELFAVGSEVVESSK